MKKISATAFQFAFMILMPLHSCNMDNKLKIDFEQGMDKSAAEVSIEVLASVPVTMVFDGEKQLEVPNGYGENEWYFKYKDSLQGYVRHIKSNRNDKHSYYFKFYTEGSKVFVDVKINGDSPLQRKVELK